MPDPYISDYNGERMHRIQVDTLRLCKANYPLMFWSRATISAT
jgi:hypothetical protein